MSVYYLHIKGGLTTSDLLNELANDDKVTNLPDSELFKTQFVDKLADVALDSHVREKVEAALEAVKPKLNAEFYGFETEAP